MVAREQDLPERPEPEHSAKAAGLIYMSDSAPGIQRIKSGKAFRYLSSGGRPVRDEQLLSRIKRLAVPPAWTKVWICPRENGHLQATGYDARGRKQYRYHARWREVRDETKYTRMIEFAQVLPKIRKRVKRDLKRKDLPREKVLAAVITLLEIGLIRVGNEEYARTNRSFGLTTMQDRHVDVNGSKMRFQFRGKSGKFHKLDIQDRRLARIVAKCQAVPGQELFQYIDLEGNPRDITSGDVNDYIKEISGTDFTAKDFRTWAGTVLAAMALQEFEKFDTKAQAKKNLLRAIEAVAQRLGNTPSICRKCYIHPIILESYLDGTMLETFQKRAEEQLEGVHSLKPEEAMVLAFLRQRLAAESRKTRPSLIDQLQASLRHRQKKTAKRKRAKK